MVTFFFLLPVPLQVKPGPFVGTTQHSLFKPWQPNEKARWYVISSKYRRAS